jgi:S1-C subfamily serine protease
VLTVAAAAALLAGGLGAGLGVAFSGGNSSTSSSTSVPVIPSPTHSTVASSGPTESTAAIAKAVQPAIVDINTDVASPASQGQEQAAGTGMIITSTGEVLTNNHVVADATKITVSIQGSSGTYGATVIGVDPTKDVALLQIEGYSGTLPTVRLGNSATAAVGDPVVAMGNALGLGQQPTTVTGIVSSLDRTITASDSSPTSVSETLHGLIETDAPIQPGDSGGPLINSQGQVIGMDTAAESASGSGVGTTLGFAIPINEARSIVQQMERGQAGGGVILGETAFLGVFDGSSSSFGGFAFGQQSVSGVPVSDVAIGSPAQAAGIVGGDTITAVDSVATPTIASLQKAIESKKPGDQVTVTYVDTSGASHTATVTLIGMPK